MNIEIILSILGIVITTFWALKSNYDKNRLEKSIKINLATIAGGIQKIREEPSHADMELRKISENAEALEKSEQRKEIIKLAHSGARDVTSTERSLGILLNYILALQMTLFNTKEIIYYPDFEIKQ